jgi:hypothetical protein
MPVAADIRTREVNAPQAAAGWNAAEALFALGAFAVLCIVALRSAPFLAEPDDFAYQASIIATTQGHALTLSAAQYHALATHLGDGPSGIPQWVRLSSGRYISQKDPGYPFLAAPFQALGIIRLAPLFYGALGCLGLFIGARRWLGPFGGAAAVGLFCSSGAALLFAWRDYMPTFTDASLIAAGTGALLYAMLPVDGPASRRTWVGVLGFLALEAAVFVRYTDIVVLGCAALVVIAAAARRTSRLPVTAVVFWLGSVAVFGLALGLFNNIVYGGPLKSGYPPGTVTFSLSAVLPNLRSMPAHLIQAMPVLVPGLAALAWITWRWSRLRKTDGGPTEPARRDLTVGLALAASWFSVWGLYSAYTWTAQPGGSTLQVTRFYVPAIGAISLLAAWLIVRAPRRPTLAAITTAAVVTGMFGLGVWSFNSMRESRMGGGSRPGVTVRIPSASPRVPQTGARAAEATRGVLGQLRTGR